MTTATALQWTTFASYIILAALCLATGRRTNARPMAVFLLTWALNGAGFYFSYLILHDGVLDQGLIMWSAVTRLHGVFLVAGLLLLTARNGEFR